MNPGAKITDYDITGLVSSGFTKGAQLEIAQSELKCTDIFPFNRNIISDLDYLPSMITDTPINFKLSAINDLSAASNTLTCTIQYIAATTAPSTRATLSKISLTSNSATKSATTDVFHVLSPIPNVFQNRNNFKKRLRNEVLISYAKHLILENMKPFSKLTQSKKTTKLTTPFPLKVRF